MVHAKNSTVVTLIVRIATGDAINGDAVQAVAYGGDYRSIPQSRHDELSERLRKQRGGEFAAYEVSA